MVPWRVETGLKRMGCSLALCAMLLIMGFLIHGGRDYEFENNLLAHLKVVISQKLAKQESFFLSWSKTAEEGYGRVSLWISPHALIAFRFQTNKSPELNITWIKVLKALSNTPRGLVPISEEEAEQLAQKNANLI